MFIYSSERALKAEKFLPNRLTYEELEYVYQDRTSSEDGRHFILRYKGVRHSQELHITQNAHKEIIRIQKIPN
jgi:hypothetical protein